MPYTIRFEKEKCIGCGACTQCNNWVLRDGKAHPKKTRLDTIGCNKDAENICPVNAIHIK
jgi:ferredoxin